MAFRWAAIGLMSTELEFGLNSSDGATCNRVLKCLDAVSNRLPTRPERPCLLQWSIVRFAQSDHTVFEIERCRRNWLVWINCLASGGARLRPLFSNLWWRHSGTATCIHIWAFVEGVKQSLLQVQPFSLKLLQTWKCALMTGQFLLHGNSTRGSLFHSSWPWPLKCLPCIHGYCQKVFCHHLQQG